MVAATAISVLTFRPILDARMTAYVREYPHDGQDSLGAGGWRFGLRAFLLLRRVDERDRLSVAAAVDAEVGNVRRDDGVLRMKFA